MTNNLKNRLIDIFWDFVINLIDAFQEIRDRVVNQKPDVRGRKIMKEINSNLRGPFFWAVLKKDAIQLDFSQGQFERGGIKVSVKSGQYRVERKLFKWGSNNSEIPWLVLENTTIGAREGWWQSQSASNQISLRLDADII